MKAAIVAVALAGAALVFAPTAAADTSTFIHDLNVNGFSNQGGPTAEVGVGRSICREFANGWSRDQVIDDLVAYSNWNYRMANEFVNITIDDLC